MAAAAAEQSGQGGAPFTVDDWRVDPAALRVSRGGEEVRLEPRVMAVLVYLAARPGLVVSRRELEHSLWRGRIVTEDAVTNAVIKLRRALGDDARDPRFIETIPKTGYRLVAAVAPAVDDAAPAAVAAVPVRPRVARRRLAAVAGLAMVLAVVLLAAAGLYDYLDRGAADGRQAGSAPGWPRVAVLPFRNLAGDPDQDWFASGIAADLVTDLARVPGLTVIAPAEAVGPGAAGRGMTAVPGVDYRVHGSVQRGAGWVRINARLVDAASEATLWARRFERETAGLFAIQDEVVAGIVGALELRLGPGQAGPGPETSVAAYEALLRGLDRYGRRSREDNDEALVHFRHAAELDPGFARARAGLALAHARRAMDGWGGQPQADLEEALGHAEAAVALDPTLAQARFALAQVELFRGHHRQAIAAVESALELAPGYADARALLAWVLHYAGRSGDALEALAAAARDSPRVPASYRQIRGEVYYVQGRHGDAARVLEGVVAQSPAHLRARLWLAAAYARLGREADAEWQLLEARALDPGLSLSRLELAFPFKDPAHLEQLRYGLNRAGLAD